LAHLRHQHYPGLGYSGFSDNTCSDGRRTELESRHPQSSDWWGSPSFPTPFLILLRKGNIRLDTVSSSLGGWKEEIYRSGNSRRIDPREEFQAERDRRLPDALGFRR
jgi:hypothetical protein